MSFSLTVPQLNGPQLQINLNTGETVFMLGANGVGKSSLMHKFYTTHRQRGKRISAHRQTWFQSNELGIAPSQMRQMETSIQAQDANAESRWKDVYAEARSSIAIYNLIDAENDRARGIAAAVDKEDMDLARILSGKAAPIKIINGLLRQSNIPIEVSVQENAKIVAIKAGSVPYSIAQLSDGERNALLLAANVLTANSNTLFLVDEPERHLHRSIISPLLTQLFAERDDCCFVISTHDAMLPLDNPKSQILLVRNCRFNGQNVSAWEADIVSSSDGLDNQIREDILGARRKILFVEGEQQSLDKALYSLVFPDVSVIPKASCSDVERAVVGIRDAGELHWISAFGIVDNDRRDSHDISRLRTKGVYALAAFSVESIYYHPEIQRRLAEKQSEILESDAETLLLKAKNEAISSIAQQKGHLCRRIAEKLVREQIFQNLPTRGDIGEKPSIEISINIVELVAEEERKLQELLDSESLHEMVVVQSRMISRL